GKAPPKSAALAALVPAPVTAQFTVCVLTAAWSRLTVKVKDVGPLSPSAFSADKAAIDTADTASFWIVPVPAEWPRGNPDELLGRETVKPSSNSTERSPLTNTVTVLLVSPARKVTESLGRVPPKSPEFAACRPEPVTDH